MDRVRGAVLAVVGAASLFAATTPAAAAAAALSPHRVAAGARTARFWTPSRVRAALLRGSPGASKDASPDQIARASSIGILDATTVDERMNGRIFAVDPREGPYSCSGTALDTPSRSIVLTAGHCVVENRSWGTHIIFVPAFDHGMRPFDSYVADAVYVTPQWRHSENNDYDVAALHVQPNALGVLEDVVGARGYTYDRSRHLPLTIFGYPAGALGGQQLRECQSTGLGSDLLTLRFGPPTLPARCDMAAGSSGGSWVTADGLIDGVTSYSYSGTRIRLYSPYFGSSIGNFLKHLP